MTLADQLAARFAELDALDPNHPKYYWLLEHAAKLQQVLNTGGGGGGGSSITQGQVSAAIDASADINTIVTALGSIDTKLTGNQFDYSPVEDASQVLWYARLNKSTGAVAYFDGAGAAGTPALPLRTVARADTEIYSNEYEAITDTADWDIGDVLTRIDIFSGGGIAARFWLNPAGNALSTNPVIGTDCQELSVLGAQQLRALNTLLTAVQGNTDQVETKLDSLWLLLATRLNSSTINLAGSGIGPAADIAAPNIIRSISLTNTNPTELYLQIHSKSTALGTGDTPLAGLTFRVPGDSLVLFGPELLGGAGRTFTTLADQRIGLSSTFATYTALGAGSRANIAINIEVTA